MKADFPAVYSTARLSDLKGQFTETLKNTDILSFIYQCIQICQRFEMFFALNVCMKEDIFKIKRERLF